MRNILHFFIGNLKISLICAICKCFVVIGVNKSIFIKFVAYFRSRFPAQSHKNVRFFQSMVLDHRQKLIVHFLILNFVHNKLYILIYT